MRSLARLSKAIDASSVTNAQYDDLVILILYSVEDSVCAASCAPDAFQLTPQRGANSFRVFKEGTRDEVDDGKGDRFGEGLTNGSGRWRRDHQLVAGIVHRGRRAFTASTPRTTSPSK